ncbi:LysR family transcriptional regulator [Sphingobium sufflavum]|uniref:LysR family transcriptional regulator n=1 Tax=Sphingobium sufflavum TaxID=1129547 RepID=UPI001F28178F|nr:LysR family transcriptional regulator [Sphingobium sufflavum]MCE7797184.1 LysR family transcriptional regulator [Sphingobium sufflavum]
MKVTLRQLEVFDAVATLGSVTAAADRLHMSQSAASSALTDLQIILKRSLFAHAKGRPLQITDEGKRLHPMVRSLLTEVSDIERAESAPLAGKLVIGATAMIAETMLPTICVDFLRTHPGVEIRIEATTATDLFDRLARFDLATALVEVIPDVEGLEVVRWRMDDLWLVVAPGHALADRHNLAVADMKGMAWCSREAGSNIAGRARYRLHEELGQFPVAFESTSNWAVRLAAIAGGGIACLSRTMVENDVEAGRLVRLDVRDFTLSRALSLARPRAIWRNRLTRAFDDFLLDRGDPA